MFLRNRAIAPVILALAATAFAQTMGTGTITGTVTDATSAVVPGVQITATNLSTGIERTVTSNSTGGYVIPALQVGTYEIKAAHAGFKTFLQKDLRLDTDTSFTV